MKCNEGDIDTGQPKNILASTLKLKYNLLSFTYNTTKRLIISTSTDHIQVFSINKNEDLVPFAPFQPACQKFVFENCVIFSKKYPNIIYYLDCLQDPSSDNISFNKESSTYYILKKCTIDYKEINESKVHIVSYESELVSFDVSVQETFVFSTVQQYLYILRGNKTNGLKINSDSDIKSVRWSNNGMLIIITTILSQVYVYDACLNALNLFVNSLVSPCLNLSPDSLFKNINFIQVSENIIFANFTNVAIIKVLDNRISPVASHLRKGNFLEALGCLDLLPNDSDFSLGFYLC